MTAPLTDTEFWVKFYDLGVSIEGICPWTDEEGAVATKELVEKFLFSHGMALVKVADGPVDSVVDVKVSHAGLTNSDLAEIEEFSSCPDIPRLLEEMRRLRSGVEADAAKMADLQEEANERAAAAEHAEQEIDKWDLRCREAEALSLSLVGYLVVVARAGSGDSVLALRNMACAALSDPRLAKIGGK